MADRKPIKSKHEAAYINAFIEWHSQAYRSRYRAIAWPDPPDAIIQSKWTTSWVEIGDVFWNDAWARDEYSYATPGECHRPIHSGVHVDMDEQFSDRFVTVLRDKLTKKSYRQAFDQYGPGYLVLAMMFPLFTGSTIDMMRQKWASQTIIQTGFISHVLLAYRHLNGIRFQHWRV